MDSLKGAPTSSQETMGGTGFLETIGQSLSILMFTVIMSSARVA